MRPLCLLLSLLLCGVSLAGQNHPNIVLLVADDLGYGELGCQGNPEIPTPHIDSLATNGIRFTQGYVTAAFCSASRAGFMTGRYQQRFGYEFNPIGANNEDPLAGLPASEKTLAEVLGDSGYVSALIGKWHLGGTARYNPMRRGFDTFYGFLHEGHYFVPQNDRSVTTWLRRRTLPGGGTGRWTSRDGKTIYSTHLRTNEPDYDADNPIYRNGQPVEESAYLTDALTREAVEFIDVNADRPFFLCLAYNAVHSPMQGAAKYMEKFAHIEDIQRRIFAAMLANLDDSVGAVLAKIRAEELEENTLIFFLSDNGGPTAELTSSNLPLRSGKGNVYEGGLRVPFLVQWKNKLPSGKRYEHPVLSLDIFATAAELAGAKLDRGKIYDGVDLMPYLTDDDRDRPHDSLYWRQGNRTAIRVGDWKLLKNPRGRQGKDWELYNLAEDISEANNLAGKFPEKKSELVAAWTVYNDQMIEPAWVPQKR